MKNTNEWPIEADTIDIREHQFFNQKKQEMKTKEQIENEVQEVFNSKIERIKFKEDSTGVTASFNTLYDLSDSTLKCLLKIGLVDIKRSGAGLKITITSLNI